MRALFSLNYVVVLVSGILAGLCIVFEVIALGTIGPTTLTVIQKMNILFAFVCQTLMLRQCPKKDQIVSVFIVVGISVSFVFYSTADDYSLRGSALGMVAALASSCMGVMSNFLYEVGAQYCSARSEVRGESLRCLIAYQIATLLVYLPALIVIDFDIVVNQGVFSGWSYETVLFISLPMGIRCAVFPSVIAYCGALNTQLVQGFDILVAYILELTFLQTKTLNSVNIGLLMTLVLATANYPLQARSVWEAALSSKKEVLKVVAHHAHIAEEHRRKRTRGESLHPMARHVSAP